MERWNQVHGSEHSMLLRCQFSPNWSIDSVNLEKGFVVVVV